MCIRWIKIIDRWQSFSLYFLLICSWLLCHIDFASMWYCQSIVHILTEHKVKPLIQYNRKMKTFCLRRSNYYQLNIFFHCLTIDMHFTLFQRLKIWFVVARFYNLQTIYQNHERFFCCDSLTISNHLDRENKTVKIFDQKLLNGKIYNWYFASQFKIYS